MPNNMISYERFTNLPVNISQFGATAEEYQITKGQADANPALAPMAAREVDELLAPRISSDQLRVDAPVQPPMNEFEGFQHDHIVIRGTLKKGRSRVGKYISEILKSPQAKSIPEERKHQMMVSLTLEHNMVEQLSRTNRLQEGIFARVIGSSKG